MSSSTLNPRTKSRFLLDENVRSELFSFLKKAKMDIKSAPRGTSDKTLAALSQKEKRVLVTNDRDFCLYPAAAIFAVVWLRIPQNDPKALLLSFSKLLKEQKDFTGKLIELHPKAWDTNPLD